MTVVKNERLMFRKFRMQLMIAIVTHHWSLTNDREQRTEDK